MISLHGIKCIIASIISLPENNALKHIDTTLIVLDTEGNLYSDTPEYTTKNLPFIQWHGSHHSPSLQPWRAKCHQKLTRICRTQRSRLLNLVRNHFSPPVPLCPDFCLNYFKKYDCLSTLTPSPLTLTALSKMISYKHSPKGRGWDCSCDPTDSFTKYNQTYQVKHSLNTIKIWKSIKSSEKSNKQNYVELIGLRELTRLL